MFGIFNKQKEIALQRERDALEREKQALNRSQAVIEFDMDGTIKTANDLFLQAMGYELGEIQGQHHSMFAEKSYAASAAYREFWAKLNRGEFDRGEYKRFGKHGKEVWIQASYNPILDDQGQPCKVIKYATVVTEQKLQNADYIGQIEAVSKSQAVIEFNMDGSIITANDNFLAVMGYALSEIRGKHHSLFAEPDYARSEAYKNFWAKLNRGEFDSGEYRRLGKNGKEVWIQATYNPIIDLNGKPFKVVKYAIDITAQKQMAQTVEDTLTETRRVMRALAEGDLSARMQGHYTGEFAELSDSIANSFDKLREVMSSIATASNVVETTSGQIAIGTETLSQRTEQQAASLEQTAASMEQMTATVQQNAANASQANQLSSQAREMAQIGGDVVGEAVTAMADISHSSLKIAEIINVIDEIAFQTNLLALNASVEAARAGEQGRGFAVVASEVRNLAQRSATAAKEINELINDSVKKVEQGSKLVAKSGETLSDIVGSVNKVSDIIAEISVASNEQSEGIQQVNKAVMNLDEMTQQNAAMVEQTASASREMGDRANEMTGLISFFRLS